MKKSDHLPDIVREAQTEIDDSAANFSWSSGFLKSEPEFKVQFM